MFNWLSNLFRSDPVAPVDAQPIYRRSVKRSDSVPPPVTNTLFERPADLPPPPVVDVVPPGTKADAYKWLDYEKPLVSAPEPIVQAKPVNTKPTCGARMASMSGNLVSFTGALYNYCMSGVIQRPSFKTGEIPLDKENDPSHYDDFHL